MSEFTIQFEKSKWFEVTIPLQEISKKNYSKFQRAVDIVYWIQNNIEGWHKHCLWYVESDAQIRVKFRYEKDCIWFKMVWE